MQIGIKNRVDESEEIRCYLIKLDLHYAIDLDSFQTEVLWDSVIYLFIYSLFFSKTTVSGKSENRFRKYSFIWQPERTTMVSWNLLADSSKSNLGYGKEFDNFLDPYGVFVSKGHT